MLVAFEIKNLAGSHPLGNIVRATKGVAYAYSGLSRPAHAYEVPDRKTEYLQLSIDALDEVKGYSLESDFLSMFTGNIKNSSESLFELQFSMALPLKMG